MIKKYHKVSMVYDNSNDKLILLGYYTTKKGASAAILRFVRKLPKKVKGITFLTEALAKKDNI